MVDRVLALLYARRGPSMIWLITAWGALAGVLIFVVIGVAAWHYFDTPPATALLACGSWLAAYVSLGWLAARRLRHPLRPALAWRDGPPTPERAAAACRALIHPKRAVRRYCWTLIALTPLNAIAFTLLLDQPWWFALPALLTALVSVGGFTTALTAATDVLQQPLRRDLVRHLPPDFEMHEQRTPLALQPVVLTPIPMLATALLVGAFSDLADEGNERYALAAGTGVLLVLGMSAVVVLRSLAWVAPIKDLIAAAQRVQEGDLSASVPIVASDETGRLAHHFNAMLVGLRERETLRTDLVQREAELRASRERIITASDAERRRVERNLHDGAQQRLVALQLDLRLLEEAAAAEGREELAELAADAGRDLKSALQELRDLARGLHPTVLDSDGLAPAIRQLTDRAPLPATVDVMAERLPPAIESTLYFVAAEALTNVVKHADASSVAITVQRDGDAVRLRVQDDGSGGAGAGSGSGIRGLADRVDAAGGTLRIASAPGDGTTVDATIPVAGAPR